MPAGTTSVLVVDDHKVVLSALVDLVEGTPGLTAWGAAASGEEALALLSAGDPSGGTDRSYPDLVVSDVQMPGMSGVELAAALRDRWPGLPCLMVSAHYPGLYADRAAAAGAVGCVEKGDVRGIIDAIERVAHGASWRAPSP
ncbi:MAG TPA: response regulator transcription factor [Rubricoccaceae bacterium]|jgi:DNA-binding NarL/FixJ family response regulator